MRIYFSRDKIKSLGNVKFEKVNINQIDENIHNKNLNLCHLCSRDVNARTLKPDLEPTISRLHEGGKIFKNYNLCHLLVPPL